MTAAHRLKRSPLTLKQQLAHAKREIRERQMTVALQRTRMHDATSLWQEKNAKPDTWPDLGELLQWLMDRGDRWQAVLEAAREIEKNSCKGAYPKLEAALKRHDEFWGPVP